MARIEGIDLPRDKRIIIALTYIYGIGNKQSARVIEETNINPSTRVRDLTEDEIAKLRVCITRNLVVEGDLRREVAMSIKRLIDIGAYRGVRHRRRLPVRGQSSKTNARTVKGSKQRVTGRKK